MRLNALSNNLFTACVTPFNADGSVDYLSLEKLLRMQEYAGNGILMFGSTGESMSLSDKEKRDIAIFVCDLKLDTAVVFGVPGYEIRAALDWINFCNNLPIDGYMMITPIYAKPGPIGQTQWFSRLLSTTTLPAILYNIPGRAGVILYPETVKNLTVHENVVAIKNSDNIDRLVAYKTANSAIEVYCGDDHMMPAMSAVGAKGLISVVSNVWPEATRQYVQNCLQGNTNDHQLWWHACQSMFVTTNPIPIKAILKETGIIRDDFVRPPLTIDELNSRQDLLRYHDAIMKWMSAQKGSIASYNNL